MDINECESGNKCEQECKNILGGYTCSCNNGYTLHTDGWTCIDINECEGNHGCNHQCNNTIGSYLCRSGFKLNCDGKLCDDIDECAGTHRCSHQCKNTFGSYICVCNYGFVLHSDGKQCLDINECNSTHGCEHACDNTVGSYLCRCSTGFKLDSDKKSCKKLNVCENSGCEQECVNTINGYVCSCRLGFELQLDGRTCKKVCQYHITNEEYLYSPGYPGNYNASVRCTWLISSLPGHYTCLSFELFDLESCYSCVCDSLVLYAGSDVGSSILTGSPLCGTKASGKNYLSYNQNMFVVFKSNSAGQKRGFKAKILTDCSDVQLFASNEMRFFYSHAAFNSTNYPANQVCSWTIRSYSFVVLYFDFFELEAKDCKYDYVAVYDGGSMIEPLLCGNKPQWNIQKSKHDRLKVVFKSDESGVYKGFSAVYWAADN